ncbi:MAG TPA: helix-turn-helix transcriptional regulator [Candidatus Sulfotelmatobacter sp.]|nr:helix-turn-helix transcriptional regulator [Candidatus Sulfotelmatobacter sp.]
MNAEELDRELARRGWNASNLAAASGCSPVTISGARRGRPISNATLSRIAEALRNAPVIPGIDELIVGGAPAANGQDPH